MPPRRWTGPPCAWYILGTVPPLCQGCLCFMVLQKEHCGPHPTSVLPDSVGSLRGAPPLFHPEGVPCLVLSPPLPHPHPQIRNKKKRKDSRSNLGRASLGTPGPAEFGPPFLSRLPAGRLETAPRGALGSPHRPLLQGQGSREPVPRQGWARCSQGAQPPATCSGPLSAAPGASRPPQGLLLDICPANVKGHCGGR